MVIVAVFRQSRTVTLKKGVYYLMPVSGDGSASYWNGQNSINLVILPGNRGEDTTIELDGFISRSKFALFWGLSEILIRYYD
jgi:hypothetical protein